MDLLQLRYFYESAKYENFSKTAQKYSVPTSSVSAAVKRLETEIGVPLFTRASNRIVLNSDGRRLADALRIAFAQIDGTIASISSREEENTEIRMLLRARSKWITDLAIEYKQSHPEVVFYISNDKEIVEFDRFDIVIDQQSAAYSDRERFLLSIEQLCIKASRSSRFAGQVLTIDQIKGEPFIVMSEGSAMRRLLEDVGKRHGFSPNIAIECNDRQCLHECAKQGMGLVLGSMRSLQEENQRDLVPLNVTDFNEIQPVYVYYAAPVSSPTLEQFLNFLRRKGL
ncbi:MAG: LysR family transcriptional regulator [Lachnospiraceae bacterium]|nr:LysR family transcriptional regulator [Lachnospiraceae bacterium]